MNLLFDLKQSASELPSLNEGLSRQTYEQQAPTRDVTGINFPKGVQHFRWQMDGVRWWIPNKSYVRMRCTIEKVTAVGPVVFTPVTVADDIAPNMNLMGNIYQSAEFKLGGKTVARISDFMAQTDTIEKRLTKSGAWLNSIGKDLDMMHEDQWVRLNAISSDGYDCKENIFIRQPQAKTGLQLGFDATDTAQYTAADKTMTFVAGGVPPLDIRTIQVIHVGDKIIGIGAAGFVDHIYLVTKIIDALTLNADRLDAPEADAGAPDLVNANLTFVRKSDEDCNSSYKREGLELIWQPPLSIFKINHALPSGKYSLSLTPQNSVNFQKRAIESLLGDKTPGVLLGNFRFNVVDLFLYIAVVEGPSVTSTSYFMDLQETRCQSEPVRDDGTLQQKSFEVSPSTFALSVAFQDTTAGTVTDRSAAKFKIRTLSDNEPSAELSLTRLYVQYAGQKKPEVDADPDFATPNDYISQLYAETMLYSGAYFDAGAGEDKNQWIRRGPYYYWSWPRDGNSESTRVNVNYQFREALGANVGSLLLFDHHKTTVLISVMDGRIVDVVIQDS